MKHTKTKLGKIMLALAVTAPATFFATTAQANPIACQALFCIGAAATGAYTGQSINNPACAPSVNTYFNITGNYCYDTIAAREVFLLTCPDTGTPEGMRLNAAIISKYNCQEDVPDEAQ